MNNNPQCVLNYCRSTVPGGRERCVASIFSGLELLMYRGLFFYVECFSVSFGTYKRIGGECQNRVRVYGYFLEAICTCKIFAENNEYKVLIYRFIYCYIIIFIYFSCHLPSGNIDFECKKVQLRTSHLGTQGLQTDGKAVRYVPQTWGLQLVPSSWCQFAYLLAN